jgi:hypothetical protein
VGKCKDIIAKQHSSLRCFAVSQDMETQL